MPLKEDDFASIRTMITKAIGEIGQMLITGKVIKRDVPRKLVWIKEIGDQPIPCVAFRSTVRYYDEDKFGVIHAKETVAEIVVPRIGDIVLIALERGTRRLPRCLGVIQSLEYIEGSTQPGGSGGGDSS
jgi:hypothetical protein